MLWKLLNIMCVCIKERIKAVCINFINTINFVMYVLFICCDIIVLYYI